MTQRSAITQPKRVFLSYAWEGDEFRVWVKQLATRLREDGVDARLDVWHLPGNGNIPEFMNREVRKADWVLVLCSPGYREKVRVTEDGERVSGVGWETRLLSSRMFVDNENKTLAVLVRGDWRSAAPAFLHGQVYFDLSLPDAFETNYRRLLSTITGTEEKAPPLGPPPPAVTGKALEALRQSAPPPDHAEDDVVVEAITDFAASEATIQEALSVYERRIPPDEQFNHEDMVGIVRRHLSDEYGPYWKMHFLVARRQGKVVGLLVAYDDLQTNFAFVSYLANDKRPGSTEKTIEATGRRLAEALIARVTMLRPEGTPLRFLFEIDPPEVATAAVERRRRTGRLKLFEQFSRFAPYKGLRVRAVDVPYLQPPLGWPRNSSTDRPLVLCYAASSLGESLPRAQIEALLDWVYLALYDSDLLEELDHRAPYKAYATALLAKVKAGLPEPVPLRRSLKRSGEGSAAIVPRS